MMPRLTHTKLVPRYKRKERGTTTLLNNTVDTLPKFNGDVKVESESIVEKYIAYETRVALYEHNWQGMFGTCKAIIDASTDPLHDRKCWAQLTQLMTRKDRLKIMKPEMMRHVTDDGMYMEALLHLQSYAPNSMNRHELCLYACMALCYPKSIHQRAWTLWSHMLDLFQRITLAEEVEAYLNNEEMQTEAKKYVHMTVKHQNNSELLSRISQHTQKDQHDDQKNPKNHHDHQEDIATTLWNELQSSTVL